MCTGRRGQRGRQGRDGAGGETVSFSRSRSKQRSAPAFVRSPLPNERRLYARSYPVNDTESFQPQESLSPFHRWGN